MTAPLRLTSDILWWRKTDGKTMVWLGSIAATASYPGIVGNDWQIQVSETSTETAEAIFCGAVSTATT